MCPPYLPRTTGATNALACGPTIDAQRFLASRDEKEQADVRIRQEIGHAVQTFIARTIGNHESPLVEHQDETRGVTLG